MAFTPHQYPGTAGKVCNCFLTTKDKDSHMLCINCHGKSCTADGCYTDCRNWTDESRKRLVPIMKSWLSSRSRGRED